MLIFVNEYNLEEWDVIRFYKPVQPLHSQHFLIEFLKRGIYYFCLCIESSNPNMVAANMGIFLFEVYLTCTDVKGDRLLIPVEQALNHFPPLVNRHST